MGQTFSNYMHFDNMLFNITRISSYAASYFFVNVANVKLHQPQATQPRIHFCRESEVLHFSDGPAQGRTTDV